MVDATLIPIAEAARWFPCRGGKPLGAKAIRKRITVGEKGVRLQAVKDGGEWFTCREWVEDYRAAVTAASLTPARVPCRVAAVKTPDRVKRLLAQRFGIHGAR